MSPNFPRLNRRSTIVIRRDVRSSRIEELDTGLTVASASCISDHMTEVEIARRVFHEEWLCDAAKWPLRCVTSKFSHLIVMGL